MDFENEFHHRYVSFKKAKNDIDALDAQFKRLGELLTGIHVFLQNSAHKGKLTEKGFYLYQTKKQSETPSFKVYYTFNERYVEVYHIRVAEEDDLLD
jgi:hypothetical protein